MRIIEFEVDNYRSLHRIALRGLGNLVVFIGKNSAGKSNIVEAMNLFFTDFALAGGATPGMNDYFWWGRHETVDHPIRFRVRIEFSTEEAGRIFPVELRESMIPKVTGGDVTTRTISIERWILNSQGTWKTRFLRWCTIDIIRDDKPQTPPEVLKDWESPSKPGMLVPEPPEKLRNISPQDLSAIQTGLSEHIKNRFKLITAVRDTKNPIQNRVTLLDNNVQSQLWTLDQSTSAPEEQRYTKFGGALRET